MGFFSELFKEPQQPTKDNTTYYEMELTSAAYSQDEIKRYMQKVAPISMDYFADNFGDRKILFKYDVYRTCDFNILTDNKNEHDPNAMYIFAKLCKLSYVPQRYSKRIREWSKTNKIYNPTLIIHSGPCKILHNNGLVSEEDCQFKLTLKFLVKNY